MGIIWSRVLDDDLDWWTKDKRMLYYRIFMYLKSSATWVLNVINKIINAAVFGDTTLLNDPEKLVQVWAESFQEDGLTKWRNYLEQPGKEQQNFSTNECIKSVSSDTKDSTRERARVWVKYSCVKCWNDLSLFERVNDRKLFKSYVITQHWACGKSENLLTWTEKGCSSALTYS